MQHPAQVRDHGIEVQQRGFDPLAAAEGEQLTGQLPRPVDRLLHFLRGRGDPATLVQAGRQERGVSRDDREDDFKLTSDLAGEAPQGLQPLCLPESPFQQSALGDVADDEHERDRVAGAIARDGARDLERADLALLGAVVRFVLPHDTRGRHRLHAVLPHEVAQRREDRLADQFRRRIAEQLAGRLVRHPDDALAVEDQQRIGHRVDDLLRGQGRRDLEQPIAPHRTGHQHDEPQDRHEAERIDGNAIGREVVDGAQIADAEGDHEELDPLPRDAG